MPPLPIDPLTLGQCATLACLLEVSAPKPGNVHRGADFDDITFEDFAIAAVAIAPAFERAQSQRVGQTILQSVAASRRLVKSNCNLGIILLLAPLAAVPRLETLAGGLPAVLTALNSDDARDIYRAIQISQAGGLGAVDDMDVRGPAPASILDAMRSASQRDDVAWQYVTNFSTIFDAVIPWILEGSTRGWSLNERIVRTHVRLMASRPDTLIARKCGRSVAEESALRAQFVLEAGEPGDDNYYAALSDLDFWLRSDGRRRNPGTSADLIAAGLFALLRENRLLPHGLD